MYLIALLWKFWLFVVHWQSNACTFYWMITHTNTHFKQLHIFVNKDAIGIWPYSDSSFSSKEHTHVQVKLFQLTSGSTKCYQFHIPIINESNWDARYDAFFLYRLTLQIEWYLLNRPTIFCHDFKRICILWLIES